MPTPNLPKNNYFLIAVGVIIFTKLPVNLTVINYAYAHSLPVTENPAPDSIIHKGAKLPSQLTIDFSERPSPTSQYYTSSKLKE